MPVLWTRRRQHRPADPERVRRRDLRQQRAHPQHVSAEGRRRAGRRRRHRDLGSRRRPRRSRRRRQVSRIEYNVFEGYRADRPAREGVSARPARRGERRGARRARPGPLRRRARRCRPSRQAQRLWKTQGHGASAEPVARPRLSRGGIVPMQTAMQNLTINPQRLWDSLMETARIGGTAKGGICRLTLTDLDRQVRDWFRAPVRGARLHGDGRRGRQHVRAEARHGAATSRRSPSAAISTRSRRAASSTACSACSAGSRRCAPCTTSATRPTRR